MRSLIFLLAAAIAIAGETKVKMQDLPAPVQQAVQKHSQGATLRGLSKEVENGKTLYEAELKVANRTKDLTFDPSGNLVIVEEEVDLVSIPEAARAAIRQTVGKRKLLLVESVTEGGTTAYEAHYRSGFLTKELKVDASGKPVK
jgi:hypothetical protein